jgi:hypothetical protein
MFRKIRCSPSSSGLTQSSASPRRHPVNRASSGSIADESYVTFDCSTTTPVSSRTYWPFRNAMNVAACHPQWDDPARSYGALEAFVARASAGSAPPDLGGRSLNRCPGRIWPSLPYACRADHPDERELKGHAHIGSTASSGPPFPTDAHGSARPTTAVGYRDGLRRSGSCDR